MKSFKVKEFKAYQSVKFGRFQVNHFYKNENNPVKGYLKDIEMTFIPEFNSILVRGSEGATLVNMSNVAEWMISDITEFEKYLDTPKVKSVSKTKVG